MRIVIPTAGVVIGAAVGAITYYTVAESGTAIATATHYGSFALGKIAGKGITILVGPTTGQVVETATIGTGQACLVPIIRSSSQKAALATAAAAGAAAALATALIVHGGTWVSQHAQNALTRFLRQAPIETQARILDGKDGFQVIDLIDDAKTAPTGLLLDAPHPPQSQAAGTAK